MRPKVVVTHPVHTQVIALLETVAEVCANPNRKSPPREQVIEHCRDADALLAFMPDIVDAAFLDACPRLKIVAAALKGFDNFDVAELRRRNIWFTMVPDLLTAPSAELAVALLLGITRKILAGDEFVRSGQFRGWRPELYGAGLSGRSAGIIGMGAIGRALAKRLAGFEMEVAYYDPRRLNESEERRLALNHLSLAELLASADYVILCAPLTGATFHLIDAQTLASMRSGSYLINICRGSLVDETAVAAALESGHLGGYAADVFELEDLRRTDRPKTIPQPLIDCRDRTLFTPHLGSAVAEVRRQIELRAAENILQALRGETPADALAPNCI
jgi:phosphonate dehydrogenase